VRFIFEPRAEPGEVAEVFEAPGLRIVTDLAASYPVARWRVATGGHYFTVPYGPYYNSGCGQHDFARTGRQMED